MVEIKRLKFIFLVFHKWLLKLGFLVLFSMVVAIFNKGPLFLYEEWGHLLFIDLLNVCSKYFFKLGSKIALQFRWNLVESKMTHCYIVSSPLYFDYTKTINYPFSRSMVLEYLNESIVVYLERCESQELLKKSLFDCLVLIVYLI